MKVCYTKQIEKEKKKYAEYAIAKNKSLIKKYSLNRRQLY
jgi:hypothetical protein